MRSTNQIFPILGTLLLALSYPSLMVTIANAASQTVTLQGASSTGWNGSNPGPTLFTTNGDTVTGNLASADGLPHTFVIDVARAGISSTPDCSIDKCSSRFTSSTTFTFTADMQPGTYTYFCSIHLNRMMGSIVVQPSASATPDFNSASNPAALTILTGSSGSAALTLTSLNGFSGSVSLTVAVSPNGPQVSLSSTTLALPSNGSASTTLTISTTSTGIYSTPIAPGAYTLTVMETSGSLSHSTTIPLSINSASPGSAGNMLQILGLSSTALFGGIIAVIAVVVVAIAAVAVRRRAKP